MESVNANALTEVTTVPTNKKLIFTDPSTNEGGIITMENLTKQILNNLTSQQFSLDAGKMTIPAAINALNGNKISNTRFAVQHIHYTDTKVAELGGLDACVKDALNNTILKDGAFYGTFIAGHQYLMIGYRYVDGNYGCIILFDYNNNERWSIINGKVTKL